MEFNMKVGMCSKIGILGLIGAGKDTLAEFIQEFDSSYRVEKFATPLKRAALRVFGDNFDNRDVKEVPVPVNEDLILDAVFDLCHSLGFNNHSMNRAYEEYDLRFPRSLTELSPRKFQQLAGDVVRAVDPDAFVRRVQRMEGNIIVTDVRFPNERGIFDKTVLVIRGETPTKGLHISEQYTQDILLRRDWESVDHVITNNGCPEQLRIKAKDLTKYW